MKHHILLVLLAVTGLCTIASISYEEQIQIPSWIKNNARWWSEGQLDDSEFIKGIQYLVQQEIILVQRAQTTSNSQSHVPQWVKNNAALWANGTIGDTDFIKGIQYLVQVNIIKITPENMVLSSSAFENNQTIPIEYTCDGANISLPLSITGTPKDAKSLVLIMDDPDARPQTFVHWIVWNISPAKTEFSSGEKITFPQGKTGVGTVGYMGPCPPSGVHHYFLKLYALDVELNFDDAPTKQDLEQSINGHVLEQSSLLGLYSRR